MWSSLIRSKSVHMPRVRSSSRQPPLVPVLTSIVLRIFACEKEGCSATAAAAAIPVDSLSAMANTPKIRPTTFVRRSPMSIFTSQYLCFSHVLEKCVSSSVNKVHRTSRLAPIKDGAASSCLYRLDRANRGIATGRTSKRRKSHSGVGRHRDQPCYITFGQMLSLASLVSLTNKSPRFKLTKAELECHVCSPHHDRPAQSAPPTPAELPTKSLPRTASNGLPISLTPSLAIPISVRPILCPQGHGTESLCTSTRTCMRNTL